MIGILGAGAYGTALAVHWSRSGKDVILFERDNNLADKKIKEREDHKKLPGIFFPDSLLITSDFSYFREISKLIFIAIPSQEYRNIDDQFNVPVIIGSKGIDVDSLSLLSDILKPKTPCGLSVWAGPQFALQVAQNLPSAVTLACLDKAVALEQAKYLSTDYMKVYPSDDLIGVQLSSALKNVIAIACGIAKGMDLGENAVAAIITRGLSEIRRLGLLMGAKEDTFLGLSGVGDMLLTCTSLTSRNTLFGYNLVKNGSFKQEMLVEGYFSAKAAYLLSEKHNVYMPITKGVYDLLYNQESIDIVIRNLLNSPVRWEGE